jgi:phage terminase large subunit
MEINLSELMNLQPKQEEAIETLLNPDCKYLLYGGAMAGGKSYLLRWAALYYLLWIAKEYGIKNVAVGLFSEDYPTLKDRQISKIIREFPAYLGDLRESRDEGFAFFVKPQFGGGTILLRNLDDPSKYMSTEFCGEFVDELTRNEEQTFQDLRNRLRWPGIQDVKFMGSTNPGGVGHGWVRKYFIDQSTDDPEQSRFKYIHASAYDNKFISPTYIKQLESLPEAKRKAYLDGSWDVFEGQIYVEFDRQLHTMKPFTPKDDLSLVGGMDWGYSAPAVVLLGVFIPQKTEAGVKFNRLIIYREIDGQEKTPKAWSEIYNRVPKFDQHKIYGDPAMFNKLQDSSFGIADQFKREGIYNINKATNNHLNKIINVHNWLSIAPDGLPYMIFTENCRNIIRTLPEATYDEHNIEDVDRNWRDDHWHDALSYLLSMLKWIDAKAGSIGKKDDYHVIKPKLKRPLDKLDLDLFAKAK